MSESLDFIFDIDFCIEELVNVSGFLDLRNWLKRLMNLMLQLFGGHFLLLFVSSNHHTFSPPCTQSDFQNVFSMFFITYFKQGLVVMFVWLVNAFFWQSLAGLVLGAELLRNDLGLLEAIVVPRHLETLSLLFKSFDQHTWLVSLFADVRAFIRSSKVIIAIDSTL